VSGMSIARTGFFNEKPPTEVLEKLRGYYNLPDVSADMDFGLSIRSVASPI